MKITESYEVDLEQLTQARKFIYRYLEDMFGVDCDHDPNVEFVLVDRQRHQASHFFPVPYWHKDLEGAFSAALSNLQMAIQDVEAVSRMMKIRDDSKE